MQFYNRLYCKARKITTKKTQAKNMVPSDFRGRNKWDLKICTFLTVCKLCFSFVLQCLLFTQPPEAVSIKFESVVYDYLIFYGFRKKNWWKFELIFSACRSPPGISWFCFKGTRAIILDEPFLKVAFSETFWSLLDKKNKYCYLQALFTFSVLSCKSGNFFPLRFWDKRLFKIHSQFVLRRSMEKTLLWVQMFSVKTQICKVFLISERKCFRSQSLWTRKKDPKAVMNL